MIHLTEKEQQFINSTDFDLNNEVIEEVIDPEDMPYYEFVARYQEKHLQKYGQELVIE